MEIRQIIFRGKTKNGQWVYGCYYKQKQFYGEKVESDCIIVTDDILSNDLGLDYEEVIPETIGQFTGLYDKNGKKIFEGDIVELEEGFWEAIYNAVLIEKEERYAVYYDDGRARYDLKTQDNNLEFKRVAWHQLVEGIVEVIGNKWDNPELLKEQK